MFRHGKHTKQKDYEKNEKELIKKVEDLEGRKRCLERENRKYKNQEEIIKIYEEFMERVDFTVSHNTYNNPRFEQIAVNQIKDLLRNTKKELLTNLQAS